MGEGDALEGEETHGREVMLSRDVATVAE